MIQNYAYSFEHLSYPCSNILRFLEKIINFFYLFLIYLEIGIQIVSIPHYR